MEERGRERERKSGWTRNRLEEEKGKVSISRANIIYEYAKAPGSNVHHTETIILAGRWYHTHGGSADRSMVFLQKAAQPSPSFARMYRPVHD